MVIGVQAVYGLPQTPGALTPQFVACSPSWTAFTSGSPFTMPWTPAPGDVLILATSTDDVYNDTAVSQANVTWSPISQIYDPNLSARNAGDLWVGTVGNSPSRNISITSGNTSTYALAELRGLKGLTRDLNFITGSGTTVASVSLTSAGSDTAACLVGLLTCRGPAYGGMTGLPNIGWNTLVTGYGSSTDPQGWLGYRVIAGGKQTTTLEIPVGTGGSGYTQEWTETIARLT